jgi:hypothetical protein
MRTPEQTAILLAVVLVRSGQTRARVSAKTIRILGRRRHLRQAFVVLVTEELAEFGWSLFEILSGGYGAIQTKTLEAAKAVTVKRWITDDEKKALRQGKADWGALEKEANPDQEQPDDDE